MSRAQFRPMPRCPISALGFLLLLLVLSHGPAVAQRSGGAAVRVGVVLDGPSLAADSDRTILEQEVLGFGAGPGVEFPARYRLTGDYTVAGVAAALDRLLAEKEVDVVLALGPIGSHELARRRSLAKPSIAALVIDAGVQGLPNAGGVSGVRNLSYIDVAFPISRTFEVFREVVPYRRLALLVHPGIPAAIPALAARAEQEAKAHGSAVTIVPVTSSADQALRAIPGDADAVYLASLEQLPPAAVDSLIQGLIRRRLPTFTLHGRRDVERGVLVSYSSEDDLARRARRVASTIQRIHSGEDPGTLPVALASVSQLTINLATARAIGFSPGWDVLTEAVLLNEEAPATGPVWSLAGVGRQAVVSNLDLKAAEQSVATGAQDTRLGRASLLPQVQAEASGTVIREATAASSLGQRAEREGAAKLVFSQTIYDDQSWANYRIAQNGEKGTFAQRRRTELEVVLRATTAYLNVLRTQAIARVERENLSLTRSNLDVAQLKERVGASGLSDVYRWQAELAQSRRRVLDSDARVQVAALELNSALNRPLEEAFQTADAGVDDPALLISDPRLLGYLDNPATFAVFRDFSVAEGVQASPEVQGIELQIASETRRSTAAKRSFFIPSVALEGGLSSVLSRGGSGSETPTIAGIPLSRGPDETWSLQLKATLPLFTGFAQSARVSRASSEVERLTLARQGTALGVSQQIRGALQLAAASWANIAQARLAADAARKNLDLVTDAYGRGAVNVITLLDAQQSALESNEAAANAVYDFLIDLMKAQRASGGFDFFYTAEERSAYYQRLESFFLAAGYTPVAP
jgi:outer membrane protein